MENFIFRCASRLRFKTTFIQYISVTCFLKHQQKLTLLDDSTPYTYSSNIENVLDNLQGALEKMSHWFSTNHLVTNAGKCQLLASSKTLVDIHISNTEILSEVRVKLLGVNLEGRLNFDFHVNALLTKASKKYHALARVCNYMNKKNNVFS